MLEKSSKKIIVSIILIALGVACRLLPHPYNFAPISAIALFSSVYLGWRYLFIVPTTAMFISDIFKGFYELPLMVAVYGSFILIGLLGYIIKKHKTWENVVCISIAGSVLFFVITNWAVWQFSAWYSHSLSGLMQCYTLALPFFRNTLLGDLFYIGVLFGAYELVYYLLARKKVVFAKQI